MKQSQLFTKTRRNAPKDEVSKNAELLIRGGYIHKEIAGVYDYLPLGLIALNNIVSIIREEMNAAGGEEVHLSALQDPAVWEATGRWDDAVVDNWFKTALKSGTALGLGFTHEEPLTRLMKDHISSYRDLPRLVYQFQTKFRNELRAKSGIMRVREFVMKDLYSFSRTEEEFREFYERCAEAYLRIFSRVGLKEFTYRTIAAGGSFTAGFTDEFQTLTDSGEDVIYIDEGKRIAINKEVFTDENLKAFGLDKNNLREAKSVEVGNIFPLGTTYSDALGLAFTDEQGARQPVIMGSYGIGLGRLLGTIAEVFADERGLVWPESVAPFTYHVVELSNGDNTVKAVADELYEAMRARGIAVLYDDRGVSAGEKFTDSDLIGIPYRVIIGKKSAPEALEVVRRATGERIAMSRDELLGA